MLKVFHLNLFIPAETPVLELSVSVCWILIQLWDFSLKAAGLVFARIWTLLPVKNRAYQSRPSNTSKKQTQSHTCAWVNKWTHSSDNTFCLHADRKVVSTHLPLAWTHSSPLEEQKLVSLLEDLAKMFQPHWRQQEWLFNQSSGETNTICSHWREAGLSTVLTEHASAEGLQTGAQRNLEC